ncbi:MULTISPECIES: hypothetical protein [Streptomyces]|uniref:hypothetical protein n=1 Tax=Streptomyces TaxID=1883 RepID=UPI003250C73D
MPTWARCTTPRTPGRPTSAWPRRRTTPSRTPPGSRESPLDQTHRRRLPAPAVRATGRGLPETEARGRSAHGTARQTAPPPHDPRPARPRLGYVQDAAVGYGYRPLHAGLRLLALLVCGALYSGPHPPAPLEAGKAPRFNAVFCTLDLLVPIITFGREAAFAPRDTGQWVAYTLIAAGWILATTVTAGISRAISRQ